MEEGIRMAPRVLALVGGWVLLSAIKMRTGEERAGRLKVKFIEPEATKRCAQKLQ